ncbi:hypothetical protein L596_022199 [Steinernema carpocapsae]|uniref:Uncharacterized protein n=1 Tax=Steinernema carpocapsae TaxID=34508 RepID=A0A4U5ML46_STECR|nr:hypothetical protein L596_022199 [Steinernema carpocapsae]
MTVQAAYPSSYRRFLCIQNLTIFVAAIAIAIGISSIYFLFSEWIPLYYRKFHLFNGVVLAILGGLVIVGVVKQNPESFLFFIAYQVRP